jgi:FkbM family methyltransferase
MSDDRCACNHLWTQHADSTDGGCHECLCPQWHAETMSAVVQVNQKWWLRLPEYRAYRPSWAWHEAARLAALNYIIRPGDVVFEVGAEEGDYGALFASWGARVVLAEPNLNVWPSIKASFEANDVEPLAWWVGFLSDHDWTIPKDWENRWGRRPDWPTCAHRPLIPEHGFYNIWEHAENTPAMTLDRLASRTGYPNVISIDVEGAELHVLNGATKTLTEHRPVVFVSVHPEMMRDLYGLDSAEVYELMADHGYERTYLATDHEVHEMFRHPEGR